MIQVIGSKVITNLLATVARTETVTGLKHVVYTSEKVWNMPKPTGSVALLHRSPGYNRNQPLNCRNITRDHLKRTNRNVPRSRIALMRMSSTKMISCCIRVRHNNQGCSWIEGVRKINEEMMVRSEGLVTRPETHGKQFSDHAPALAVNEANRLCATIDSTDFPSPSGQLLVLWLHPTSTSSVSFIHHH